MKNLKNLKSFKNTVLNSVCFLFLLVLCMTPLKAQTSPFNLIVDKIQERQINGGKTQVFQFNVESGFYARAEIEHKNIDIVVSLFAPDGKLVIRMDSGKDGSLWREEVSCLADTGGIYTLEIKAYGANDLTENYEIKLAENRRSAAKDIKRIEAEKHLSSGREFYYQLKFTDALKEYQFALATWDELGDEEWKAVSMLGLGWIYGKLSQIDQAIDAHSRAIELFKKTKDRVGEGKAMNGLGNSYYNLSQYEKALEWLEKGLTVRRENGDKRGVGSSLNNLGNIYNNLADYPKARDYFEQSLVITRETKNRSIEGLTLSNLGTVYESLGEYAKAQKCYEEALQIVRDFRDLSGECGMLINLGNIRYRVAQYEESKNYFEQALKITKQINETGREEESLIGLATVYSRLGQYQKSKDNFESALEIAKKTEDRIGESLILIGLAEIYKNLLQKDKAREFYENALKITREIKDKNTEAVALIHLGNLFNDSAEYEKAAPNYEEALKIAQEIKDRIDESEALINLGRIYVNLNQLEKAKIDYEQALLITREIKDRSGEAAVCYNLMILWQKLNNPRLAIIYGKQSVNAYQEILNNIRGLDKEIRRTFLAGNVKVYRSLSDLLIGEGRILEAEQVLNMLKSEEFGAVLSRGSASEALLPYSAAEEAATKIIDRLAALAGERSELLKLKDSSSLPAGGEKRLNELDALLTLANAEFRRTLENLAGETQTVFDLKQAQTMQSDLHELGAGTVAIYTLVVCGGDDSPLETAAPQTTGVTVKQCENVRTGWIILVTPNFRKAYPIDVKELNQTVALMRQALSSDKYDPQPTAKKLYDMLFRQTSAKQKTTLEADLNEYFAKIKALNKTLMWSLDGVLRYIPIAALHDGEKYLVEKYRNTLFTTASFSRLKDRNQPGWKVFGLGVSEARDGFNALPGVRRELLAIVRDAKFKNSSGILPGTIRLDNDFTRQALLEGLQRGYQVVHLASHFSYKNKQEDSFLLLGDGHLRLGEMRDFPQIFEKVDLLTLSACNTATTDADNGKEVESLSIVAQALGAKSVIASLWEVADNGTDELMTRFYKLRSTKPTQTKGEAFRQAQLALLEGEGRKVNDSKSGRAEPVDDNNLHLPLFKRDDKKPFSHPHYWASFVLIGNWK